MVPGRKTDVADPTWLAELEAHGLVKASFVPPEPIRQLRDLTRERTAITRASVSCSRNLIRLFASRGASDSSPGLVEVGACDEFRSAIVSHRFRHDGQIPDVCATRATEESESL